MKTIKHVNRVACLALVTLAIACDRIKITKEEPPPPPPEVGFVAVEQRDVPIYREWVGTLAGEVNATISAQVGGYLLKQEYEEGRPVKQGDVLFQIDPAPFQATLAKAQAALEEAKARKGKTEQDVIRYKPLAEVEAISKQELDDAIQADKAAAAQVSSGEAAVKEAQLNLDFTTIRSPVNGVAGVAQAQIGNLVGPSTGALTTVSQIEPMRVYFSISQQLRTELHQRLLDSGQEMTAGQGPPLEIVLAEGTIYPEKGVVRFSDNQVDIKTGTIRVVGVFPNPNGVLVPGMFVRVRALLDTQRAALLVPQRAVTDMQGRYLIAVVGDDNKVSVRPVEVGERLGSSWVVKGNLKPGDRVVAEGVQKVRDGTLVAPTPAAAAAPSRQVAKENDERSPSAVR